ncbi:MAG: hypothetical protein AB8G15_04320 [Saprospiraceae bacterium]
MAKKNKKTPEVHKDLSGFDIKINEFGEITSNFGIDKINAFLDKNVVDKKLAEQQDDKMDATEEE